MRWPPFEGIEDLEREERRRQYEECEGVTEQEEGEHNNVKSDVSEASTESST